MATIDEIRDNRIKKLNKLKIQGINPFPIEVKRTHTIFEVLDKFSELSKQEEEIYLVGRIRSQRGHGKASFLNIEDGTGSIQGLIRADGVGSSRYEFYNEIFDIGDFIQVKGGSFCYSKRRKNNKY